MATVWLVSAMGEKTVVQFDFAWNRASLGGHNAGAATACHVYTDWTAAASSEQQLCGTCSRLVAATSVDIGQAARERLDLQERSRQVRCMPEEAAYWKPTAFLPTRLVLLMKKPAA